MMPSKTYMQKTECLGNWKKLMMAGFKSVGEEGRESRNPSRENEGESYNEGGSNRTSGQHHRKQELKAEGTSAS